MKTLSKQAALAMDSDNFLKAEVARAFNVSERTIDTFTSRGMPVVRFSNRKLLFPKAACRQWFAKTFPVCGVIESATV